MRFKSVWKEMLAKLPKPERSTSWVQLTDQTQQGSSNRFYYKYYFTLSFSASSIKFFRFAFKPFSLSLNSSGWCDHYQEKKNLHNKEQAAKGQILDDSELH